MTRKAKTMYIDETVYENFRKLWPKLGLRQYQALEEALNDFITKHKDQHIIEVKKATEQEKNNIIFDMD